MNLPICDAMVAAALDSAANPEGLPVLVVGTDDEGVARIAAPMVAARLHPGRSIGDVLHVERLDSARWEVVVRDMGLRRPPK